MAKPAVVLIGADKGGVGKTTVSRTLLDYFLVHKIPTRVFDTEYPKGTLKRFHPEITEVVDITSVPAQMKIFDTIYSSGTQITLLDIRAGTLSSTLHTLRDIGFLEMARRNQIIFALFHILGPSIASLDEIAETSKILIEAQYFLVKNFINNTGFFDWDQATYNSYFKNLHHAGEITIPKLNEMACEQVELASVPFATFAAKTLKPESSSFVLRGYVCHWLDNVFAEYDRVKLTDIVAPKDAALKSVVVHNYTILDTKTAEPKPGPGKRTAEKIEQNKHAIVPGTAEAVDAHLIDDTGKYRPEWTKLLRH
jgi:hypothetical protein